MSVENFQMVADPGAGALKTFHVIAGSSVRLTARVTNGAMHYAVQLKDLGKDGVLNPANLIAYTPDPDWTPWGSPTYYINTTESIAWGGNAIDWDFDLLVSITTPPDFYRFQFTVSGVDGYIWTQNEPFYVQVLPVPEPALNAIMALIGLALLHRRMR